MPDVVRALAEPLTKVDKITVISTGADGNGQGTGVNRVATDVTSMIAQFPAMLESLTGVRLDDLLKNVPQTGSTFREHERGAGRSNGKPDPVPARRPERRQPPVPRVEAEPVNGEADTPETPVSTTANPAGPDPNGPA
jgi:hypothetical protein